MNWKLLLLNLNINELKEYHDLSDYSYIKVGGKARFFIETMDFEIIKKIFALKNMVDFPVVIVGNGTNMCFSEGVIEACFIKILKNNFFEVNNEMIRFNASMNVMKAIQIAHKHNLIGLEYGFGIPGSIGGAVKMNAGTKNGETKDVLSSVELIDKDGLRQKDVSYLDLSYRHSNVEDFVWSASFNLKKVDDDILFLKKKEIRGYLKERNEQQPVECLTLGSTFKNPPNRHAAKLLEENGLKGYRVNDISFSEKHANFLINHGNGKYEDIKKIISIAREKVFKDAGLTLELEIKMISYN